jgi:sarcosine oxidase
VSSASRSSELSATHDVIVVGGGAMGSAAAAHLAAAGQRVLLLERFSPGHEGGSSHGLTRIIRLAYFEHPSYVPLLRRAYELWFALEGRSGETLLHRTGGLDIGAEGTRVFEGSLASCGAHDLPHEVLDGDALTRRFPAWRVPRGTRAVLQPDAGFLLPERCIAAHLAMARAHGADVRFEERVREWASLNGRVRVTTDRGAYEAGQLVLAAGAWMGDVAPSLASRLVVERQVLGWFEVADRDLFAPARFPIFVHEAAEGTFYGFPEFGVPGLKIGRYHHRAECVDPDSMDRTVGAADERVLRDGLARYLPGANGARLDARTCLFTNTRDEHFIVARDPSASEVLLLSPCSGHGFKFASVIGEVASELVTRGSPRHEIGLFRWRD